MTRTCFTALVAALLISFASVHAGATSRIKDLANIEGVRQNQLIGYGLVVGLNGTGVLATVCAPGLPVRFCVNRPFNALLRSPPFGLLGAIVTAASVARFCTIERNPCSLPRTP